MTMTSAQGTFTTTTEVIELTNTTLDAPLFDMPPGCKVTDMSAMAAAGMAPPPAAGSTAPAPSPAASAPPAAPPAPSAPPKAAGVLRVGIVPIKDSTGQSLPTDSLQLDLLSEFSRNQIDTVVLTTDTPLKDVESEAREKQCDYFVYTVPTVLKEIKPPVDWHGAINCQRESSWISQLSGFDDPARLANRFPNSKTCRSPPMRISSGSTRCRPHSFRSPTKLHSRLRTIRIRRRLRSQLDRQPSREQPQPRRNDDDNVGEMRRR